MVKRQSRMWTEMDSLSSSWANAAEISIGTITRNLANGLGIYWVQSLPPMSVAVLWMWMATVGSILSLEARGTEIPASLA